MFQTFSENSKLIIPNTYNAFEIFWIPQNLHIKPTSSSPSQLGNSRRVPLQPVTAKRISSSYGNSNVFTLTTTKSQRLQGHISNDTSPHS